MAMPSDKNILTDADGMPIPQIWDSITEDFVPYEGKVKVDGQVSVSDSTAQQALSNILTKLITSPATESKQDLIKGVLDSIQTLLTSIDGKSFATTAKQDSIITELQSIKSNQTSGNAATTSVARTVDIGGTNYRMIDSNTLVGLAANQPTAAAAASAIGIGVMYWSIDTDTIEVSTGSLWKVVI